MNRMVIESGVARIYAFLATLVIGTTALRNITVVIPPVARTMDTVSLSCDYDLEGDPLYTIKWYKGTKEFYRYIPKELPNTRVFALPGIDVDLSKSNPKRVVLRNVLPEVTGKYKCEVSTDAPDFYTAAKSGYLYIIDLPSEEPILTVDRGLLEMGYALKANCSSPPFFPPFNITWYLNGKKIDNTLAKISQTLSQSPGRRLPALTLSTLEMEVSKTTFHNGTAKLSCVVDLFDAFKKDKEVILEDDRPRPRPSSVLSIPDAVSDSFSLASSSVSSLFSVCIGMILLR